MEFCEKLQELRKNKGLTQEELAQGLYVSRTAVSKWESGRGYPSIESLKEIAKYFSVTIDDLLSGEKLLSIAENENRTNIKNMCDLLMGIADVLYIALILLPVYSKTADGHIFAVNLFSYLEIVSYFHIIYLIVFAVLTAIGSAKILLLCIKVQRGQKILTVFSMILSILTVLMLALTREAYAVSTAFLLLIIKGTFLLKYTKADEHL